MPVKATFATGRFHAPRVYSSKGAMFLFSGPISARHVDRVSPPITTAGIWQTAAFVRGSSFRFYLPRLAVIAFQSFVSFRTRNSPKFIPPIIWRGVVSIITVFVCLGCKSPQKGRLWRIWTFVPKYRFGKARANSRAQFTCGRPRLIRSSVAAAA
eukprot:5098707-Lingulodinium_polyedra.AAC.1